MSLESNITRFNERENNLENQENMIIDYTKKSFSRKEISAINMLIDKQRLKNPDHLSVIFIIESKIIKLDKFKFMLNKHITVLEIIKTIKKFLKNYDPNDILKFYVKHNEQIIYLNNYDILQDIYNKYRYEDLQLIQIYISRETTFKWIKNIFHHYIF